MPNCSYFLSPGMGLHKNSVDSASSNIHPKTPKNPPKTPQKPPKMPKSRNESKFSVNDIFTQKKHGPGAPQKWPFLVPNFINWKPYPGLPLFQSPNFPKKTRKISIFYAFRTYVDYFTFIAFLANKNGHFLSTEFIPPPKNPEKR